MTNTIAYNEYISWLNNLKQKVNSVQQKTVVAVKTALIQLYWEFGQQISEQQYAQWGDKLIPQLSRV